MKTKAEKLYFCVFLKKKISEIDNISQLIHPFSVHRFMMHAGCLETTKEMLEAQPTAIQGSRVLSKFPNCIKT